MAYKVDESFLPAEIYNTIPHIDLREIDNQEREQSSVRDALLKVIRDHGMEDIFSLHLLHRHYDLPSNHAMVYEQDSNPESLGVPFLEICSPRCLDNLDTLGELRGKFFFYRRDTATMSAYEFTTEVGPNITSPAYSNFIQDFTHQLLSLKMENVFALSISPPSEKARILYEIEIPRYCATFRVEKASWVPDGFSTDWAGLDGKSDGIYENAGSLTRSKPPLKGKHGRRRAGQHSTVELDGLLTDPSSVGIVWDDERLDQTSTAYTELARILDQPFFPWKKVLVGFSLGQYLLEGFLSLRQYKFLQATKVPKVLEGEVSQEVFDKSQAYGRAKAQFGFVSGLYSQIQNLGFIYFDALPKLWGVSGLLLSIYAPEGFRGEITHTLIFVFVFNIITTVLSLPTSYYSTFVLEEKFGFNKQTLKLWVMDMLKGQMLTVVLGTPIISAILKIVQTTGTSFFYYLWMFGIFVQLFAITIYPVAILPLFNKLSPLEPGVLKTGVENLAKRLKFPLSELNVIDGSKRSAHSNAYFFGLPWKKHIVIYDTLIEKSEPEEVIAVLSHELGHWSLSHTTKLFGIGQFHMFYIFALFSAFVTNKSLYQDFGFHNEMPIMIGFLLFSDALAPTDAIIKLLMNILSRKFEFEADAFAVSLGYSKELARSLLKLQIQNLSTMDADWMYASYHYSHPILSERLAALGWKGGKITGEKEPIDSDKAVKAADREL
ncbi:CAAX prenyl protease 1 [Arthroderma uncinatum]|uniref:CAAX prenyl protease 1 n=1 Tax=Arthroderma uncinatum TaxID=74035 RepID=UPI00144AC3B6|nr:CAAX prenyl protease 1 [Arthroderma uncinatum]KAF3481643.1 CAAX prenyl protease 1 [Arthroderma uncinatum]